MGGSSGGGGSSSGQVSYPAYMSTWHETWLDNVATAMTAAQGADPFGSATAYDPDAEITEMESAVVAFEAVINALAHEADWSAAVSASETGVDSVIDDTYINAEIAAFANILDDQVVNKAVPSFESGMRDINAVMSSSFAVGKALIYAFRDRDVANYAASLRSKLTFMRNDYVFTNAAKILELQYARVSLAKELAHYIIEFNRIKIVAKKEQADQDLAIDESSALWDLQTFQYGNNVLSSIAGGTSAPGKNQRGTANSAIGGALSGAATGAMIGTEIEPGYGTAIGAVIGGIGGYLMS